VLDAGAALEKLNAFVAFTQSLTGAEPGESVS